MTIKLTQLTIENAPAFLSWIADKEAVKYSLSTFQPERDDIWVRSYLSQLDQNRTSWNQVIVHDGLEIGYCGLSNISEQNRAAEYFILIGSRAYWNRGIGTEVGKQVLDYGFLELGLHRIWLTVSELNLGAVISYEKLGFVEEGRMREACYRDSHFHDKIVMSILENHWPKKIWGRSQVSVPEL